MYWVAAKMTPFGLDVTVRLLAASHGLDATDAADLKRFCAEMRATPTEFVYRLWLVLPDDKVIPKLPTRSSRIMRDPFKQYL